MPEVLAYIILYFLIFMTGACIGSFYNVITLRVPIKESFVKGRSHCPKCKHELSALDLVPFFSWIFLGGKCRYCKEKISIRYPLIELLGGLSACFCVWQEGFTFKALFAFVFVSILTVVAIFDLETTEIPDTCSILIAVLALISFFSFREITWYSALIGAVVISLPMWGMAEIKGGFGGGDIKLMAAAGLLLGWKAILCGFMIGIFASAIYVIYLLVVKKAGMRTAFVFGPYLSFGIAVAYFFSDQLISFYLGMFSL